MSQQEDICVQGIHFCPRCHNILKPMRGNDSILELNCNTCKKVEINFSKKKAADCLVYSKQGIEGGSETKVDKDFVTDPTMPRISNIYCDFCETQTDSVYTLVPQAGEKNIKVWMLCTTCRHERELPLSDKLTKEMS